MTYDLSTEQGFKEASDFFSSECIRGGTITLEIAKKQRTSRQNRSLHLLFKQLADQFNETGKDVQTVLSKPVSIPWNETLVKELIFRPVMKVITGKKSTAELTTVEIDKCFEILSKHLGETLGLEIEWPSIETLIEMEKI